MALAIFASSCNSQGAAKKLHSQAKFYPDKMSSYCPRGKQVSRTTVARAVALIDNSEINNSYYPYQTLLGDLRKSSGFEARYHNLELPLSHMAHDLAIRGGSVHALGVIMMDRWEGGFRPVYVEIKLLPSDVMRTSWYLFSSSYRGDVCQ